MIFFVFCFFASSLPSLNETELNAVTDILFNITQRRSYPEGSLQKLSEHGITKKTTSGIHYTVEVDSSFPQDYGQKYVSPFPSDFVIRDLHYVKKKNAFDYTGIWNKFSEKVTVRNFKVNAIRDVPDLDKYCYQPREAMITFKSNPSKVNITVGADNDLSEYGAVKELKLNLKSTKSHRNICFRRVEIDYL